jgi:primase-polymerase (primpol)-like protein
MTLSKGRKIAEQGHAGGESEVYDANAAVTAPGTTNQYSQLPPELKTWEIWLPFRTSPRPSVGLNKIPQNRQGRPAKYTDPATWMSYEEAARQSQRPGYEGVGIVLHKELGLMGIDFDHCIVDGVPDPEVEGWVAKLNTYTELSFSGEGLHSLAYGKLPWKANRSGKVEMYTDARFFVVTGRQVTGTPDEIMPAQAVIDAIHGQVFGNQPVETVDTTAPYYTEREEGELSTESLFPDDTVMAALRRNAVARKYFDGSVVTINASSADWDLARSLAFFCQGNLAQMRRLFMKSSLVREKTVSKRGAGDYLDLTLGNAAARQRQKNAYWMPRVRTASGAPEGRRQSATTTAIITLRAARPELTYQGTADELDIKIETVSKAIHRMQRRERPSCPSWVVGPEPAIAKEAEAILDGKPVQEELMSCPRRYRADYAKPKGWVDIPYKPILPDGVTYESNYVLPPRRKPPIRSFNIRGPLPVNIRRVA